MRFFITLFTLTVAQLLLNQVQASPQTPVNVDQQRIISADSAERRKRGTTESSSVKKTKETSAKKNRLTSVNKKRQGKKRVAPEKRLSHRSASATRKPAHQAIRTALKHDDRSLATDDNKTPLRLSRKHLAHYQQARNTAITRLMNQLGKPYQTGGASPGSGFDCSGLVWYAYKDLVKFHIPRTANEMYHLRNAAPVQRNQLEKGDLVFFRINGRGRADHVGVYLGAGRFIQSPRSGKTIQVSQLEGAYWQRHYIGARRVMTPGTIR